MKKDEIAKVGFHNTNNPSSGFDLIPLSDVINKQYVDHTPLQYHQVNFFLILCITRGHGKHTIDFVEYDCSPGTILIVRKDQIHKFEPSNLEGQLVAFTLEFLGSFFEKTEAQKSHLIFNEFLISPKLQLNDKQFDAFRKNIERLSEEYNQVNDTLSPGIIRSELQILISKLYRIINMSENISHDKKYLTEFISFHKLIEEKHTESLKVKDYARWLAMSTKTLNTVTLTIVNKNAKEFINEICLNHIKRKLINSDLSIKEISFDMGFKETSNFYTYFKKNIGQTPEDYRRSHQ